MNLAPSPTIAPPFKTRNQLILEHIKNTEDFELLCDACAKSSLALYKEGIGFIWQPTKDRRPPATQEGNGGRAGSDSGITV